MAKKTKKQKLSETAIPFKSEGNRQQYNHVDSIITFIEAALTSLDLADITATKANLHEALIALKQRQKLIKVADRSSLGWATVKEYIADDLADDSDDEKRLRKAEKSAASKKADLAKKAKGRATFRQSQYAAPLAWSVQPAFRHFSFSPAVPAFGADHRICFQCGITSHVRANCPSLRALRSVQQQPAAAVGTATRVSPA